ncbi:MAG: type II toxin-antitoxin system VapC family toxin [Burkholderiales bacterium]|nr:type II toxin-antitoxin system VapC family toxin [Burkholderiales bacterium]MDE2454744.1 type II toxin-antitoxin system VapC family toxin [Burkholderiales bacterium]
MKLLLDTHVLLWATTDSPRIKAIRKRLLAPDNEVFFSVASLWEIAIKVSLGKLKADAADIREAALEGGFIELPVLGQHALQVGALPRHHRDPFDRLLIAQAAAEPMRLLTADEQLLAYGGQVEII